MLLGAPVHPADLRSVYPGVLWRPSSRRGQGTFMLIYSKGDASHSIFSIFISVFRTPALVFLFSFKLKVQERAGPFISGCAREAKACACAFCARVCALDEGSCWEHLDEGGRESIGCAGLAATPPPPPPPPPLPTLYLLAPTPVSLSPLPTSLAPAPTPTTPGEK